MPTTPTIFLPFLGEYGIMLSFHCRHIHNYPSSNKIVCCPESEKIYFPSASSFFHDYQFDVPDIQKVYHNLEYVPPIGLREKLQQLYPHHQIIEPLSIPLHVPEEELSKYAKIKVPIVPTIFQGIPRCDVILGCRMRQYKSEKNWTHWDYVVQKLLDSNISVGVIGQKDTSFMFDGVIHSFDYPDYVSANIEMLGGCRVYVGTDTGTTHLASMMDVPIIAFKKNRGGLLRFAGMTSRAYFEEVSCWEKPDLLVERVIEFLSHPF